MVVTRERIHISIKVFLLNRLTVLIQKRSKYRLFISFTSKSSCGEHHHEKLLSRVSFISQIDHLSVWSFLFSFLSAKRPFTFPGFHFHSISLNIFFLHIFHSHPHPSSFLSSSFSPLLLSFTCALVPVNSFSVPSPPPLRQGPSRVVAEGRFFSSRDSSVSRTRGGEGPRLRSFPAELLCCPEPFLP